MFGFFDNAPEDEEPVDISKLDTTSDLFNKVKEVIDNEVAPALAEDGGSVSLVGLDGTIAVVTLMGACAHCPSATITLQYGVQSMLIEAVPEITGVKRAG